MKVNIRTRLLTYFLFASILPICVLTFSSTALLQLSINEEIDNELNFSTEKFWDAYYICANNLKQKLYRTIQLLLE